MEPSFGLLFGDVLRNLKVSTTGAAVIVSTQDTLINFSGLLAGPLLRKFSYRAVSLFGAALVSIGILSTTFATSVPHIITTYGIIVGIGVGLSSAGTFVAISHYWSARRGQAVGTSMAGAAIGFMVFPQLVRYLLEELGFQGAMLVLGGITLHGIVGATLLQPVEWHLIPGDPPENNENDEDNPLLSKLKTDGTVLEEDETSIGEQVPETPEKEQPSLKFARNISVVSMSQEDENRRPSKTRKMSWVSLVAEENAERARQHGVLSARKTSMISASALDITGSCLGLATASKDDMGPCMKSSTTSLDKPKKPTCWQRVSSFLDLDLLRDPHYMLVSIGLALFWVAELHFKMVVPFFLSDLGIGKSDVAFCLSFSAVSDIIVRLILPPLCDRLNFKRQAVFFIACVCLGVSRSALAAQTEWMPLLVMLVFCGFCRGATLINYQLTVAECVSLERLPGAYGLHMVAKGVAVVSLGPLLGYVRDMTGSYAMFMHSQSALIALGLLPWVLEWSYLWMRSRNSKEKKTDPVDTQEEITSI